jgi:hypothetical protein
MDDAERIAALLTAQLDYNRENLAYIRQRDAERKEEEARRLDIESRRLQLAEQQRKDVLLAAEQQHLAKDKDRQVLVPIETGCTLKNSVYRTGCFTCFVTS